MNRENLLFLCSRLYKERFEKEPEKYVQETE
jgi:YHS domain-containing protein